MMSRRQDWPIKAAGMLDDLHRPMDCSSCPHKSGASTVKMSQMTVFPNGITVDEPSCK